MSPGLGLDQGCLDYAHASPQVIVQCNLEFQHGECFLSFSGHSDVVFAGYVQGARQSCGAVTHCRPAGRRDASLICNGYQCAALWVFDPLCLVKLLVREVGDA